MELTLIDSGATTAEQLKQFADRMENLLNEIDGLKSDLKDLKGEAKSAGFNIKALDRLVAIRRKDSADAETELLNDLLLYAHATGTQLDLAIPDTVEAGARYPTFSATNRRRCPFYEERAFSTYARATGGRPS